MRLSSSAPLILNDASSSGCVIFFSIVVLGANAHYIALETGTVLYVDDYQVWPTSTPDTAPVVALAVAVVSLVTVKPM